MMMGARFRPRASVRSGYWFRQKRFGFGAVPATWQGWAATSLFVALAGLLANLVTHRGQVWLLLFVPLVISFVWLVAIKTEGDWRFRWGDDA